MNLKGEHEQILEWLQTAVLNEERPITEMFAIENQRIGGRPRADRAARCLPRILGSLWQERRIVPA